MIISLLLLLALFFSGICWRTRRDHVGKSA